MDSTGAPDVMLLSSAWPERAALRAQLIEEGYEVVAIESWPMPRAHRRAAMKPRVLVIDLHELAKPRQTLDEVRSVMPPGRVLVITAAGTVPSEEIQRLGFTVIARPATVAQIVAATAAMLPRTPQAPPRVE